MAKILNAHARSVGGHIFSGHGSTAGDGYGPELLADSEFDGDGSYWTVTGADGTHIVTFSGGRMRYQSGTTSPQLLVSRGGVLSIGETYLLTVETALYTSGSLKTDSFGTVVLSSGVGIFQQEVTANQTSFGMTRNSSNVDLTLERVSLRLKL